MRVEEIKKKLIDKDVSLRVLLTTHCVPLYEHNIVAKTTTKIVTKGIDFSTVAHAILNNQQLACY